MGFRNAKYDEAKRKGLLFDVNKMRVRHDKEAVGSLSFSATYIDPRPDDEEEEEDDDQSGPSQPTDEFSPPSGTETLPPPPPRAPATKRKADAAEQQQPKVKRPKIKPPSGYVASHLMSSSSSSTETDLATEIDYAKSKLKKTINVHLDAFAKFFQLRLGSPTLADVISDEDLKQLESLEQLVTARLWEIISRIVKARKAKPAK